jgi:hypothetical protein
MSKRDYLKAVAIVKGFQAKEMRHILIDAFVALFREEGSRFDEAKFREACEEGAR